MVKSMQTETIIETLPAKIKSIKRLIKEEYLNDTKRQWLIGFSGGKDSTLLLHLIVDVLMNISPEQRTRPIYIVSNDTRVESPVYLAQVNKTIDKLKIFFETFKLPVTVSITTPDPEKTFWVNILGKGYPAPNRVFRWCTDRMKIEPTTFFIKNMVNKTGECLLFLGVRKAESAARNQRIKEYQEKSNNQYFNKHNDIPNCIICTPIVNLSDNEVWQALLTCPPSWGGSHRDLVTLYRNGKGGECPFVTDKTEAPSCGSGSARFGCWTCTVVEKDSSLEGLIESGFENLEPLVEFRNLLKEVSNNPNNRLMVRRTGQIGPGPLTIETRKMLLQKLLEIQETIGTELIIQAEIRIIKDWWQKDETTLLIRQVNLL
ncbi:MAG: DNA phosphorothioation system sulfurtransferase DndC [Rickettsiales bacterium]|nr:DNA phosphorothioation system sulfurtransferase DndC [Rickettsiales bacterium]